VGGKNQGKRGFAKKKKTLTKLTNNMEEKGGGERGEVKSKGMYH